MYRLQSIDILITIDRDILIASIEIYRLPSMEIYRLLSMERSLKPIDINLSISIDQCLSKYSVSIGIDVNQLIYIDKIFNIYLLSRYINIYWLLRSVNMYHLCKNIGIHCQVMLIYIERLAVTHRLYFLIFGFWRRVVMLVNTDVSEKHSILIFQG
jgi:hypothetical protein